MFWKKKSKDPIIKFYLHESLDIPAYHPVPGDRAIPEWFRKTARTTTKDKLPEYLSSQKNMTIKKCMPVLDAMTGGYVVRSPADMVIKSWQDDKDIHFDADWCSSGKMKHPFITHHGTWQLGKHSLFDKEIPDAIALKFNSWFHIVTPPGYSCLFTSHLNNDHLKDLGIEFISAIVDTDDYNLNINFPFIFTNLSEKGAFISQGTPLIQVFPFKRESWSHEIIAQDGVFDDMSKKLNRDVTKLQSVFHDSYRKNFRAIKKFK